MATARAKVDETVREFRAIMSAFASSSNELMAHWKGPSADVFARACKVYEDEFLTMFQALDTVGERLGISKNKYDAFEESQSDQANKIMSLLNNRK
ncbi:hypothetical protein NE235_03130 [Actinoallomurus spadix]|uniref:WXG100 family type VII secretion target n=1 Tax=Actinoallomurus spadix TaxID=79912 RepID=UPI002093BD11|nr:hypothetical protein [Actinoallomurus spadix]MCO5985098.1 hypothetical protein [Actinoallomurus spadix]